MRRLPASRTMRAPARLEDVARETLDILPEVMRDLAGLGRGLEDIGRRMPGMKFARITVDPAQMGGVPCIRGLRIPVATVVGMVADGMATDEILKAYPDLTAADIQEALKYAAEAVRERELPLTAP